MMISQGSLDEFRKQNREKIANIHGRSMIIDAEGLALLLPTVHLEVPAYEGKSYLDRAIAAGLTAMNTSMGIGGLCSGKDDLRSFLHAAYGYLAYFEMRPDKLIHVETVADLHKAKREKKLGIIFGVQGLAGKVDGDVTLIRILAKLGLRVAQLTNNDRNALGSGVMEPADTGLSIFGRGCVRELHRVGVVVDLAHAGEKTIADALEMSKKPCIISHANVRKLCDHRRNATDATLKALAKNGGVIGMTGLGDFNQKKKGAPTTIQDFVDHISYVADLIGIDHVGIGSDVSDAESEIRHEDFLQFYPDMQGDFPFGATFVKDFERVDDFPNVTAAMCQRGFAESDIAKVLGGNFMRVFEACWPK